MIQNLSLEAYLAKILEPEKFEDYVPNGLQIEGTSDIRKLLCSPSISTQVINRAVECGAQAILVHHGLFWKNDPRVLKGIYRDKIRNILTNGINIFAYHLPLDFHARYGNNEPVLRDLGMKKIRVFANIGYIGELKKEISFTDYKQRLDDYFQVTGKHISREGNISSVAIVSGNGTGYFQKAVDEGIDAFISGEGTEWIYQIARDNNIAYSAMGHYRTEWTGVQRLGKHLAKKFSLEFEFFAEENPF